MEQKKKNLPEVTLGQYKGLAVTRHVRPVTDKTVDIEVLHQTRMHAVYHPTTEPATAHTQQLVTYLFKHTLDLLDGCPIAEATPDKIADLREKYEHLDDGMSYWSDGGVNYLREWKYADAFGEKNNIKFTVTISADLSLATDGMKRYL